MGLVELGLAAIIAITSGVGSGTPMAAWYRTREYRFLLLSASSLSLLVMGLIEVWAQLQATPPSFAAASLPILALVAISTVLLLATGMIPRRP